MKKQQTSIAQGNPLKREQDGQLKELIQSYFTQIGNDMQNVWNVLFHNDSLVKSAASSSEEKNQRNKRVIECGRIVLLSTVAVLLCTMIGIFEYQAVLLFGLIWGFIFTKYKMIQQQDLTQMVLYWMIFSLLICLQNILKLGLFFMPFYHSLKLFFIISLLYPKIDLKSKIYKDFFAPRITILSQNLSVQK